MTWPGSSLGHNEYLGMGAVPMSGKGNLDPLGSAGGSVATAIADGFQKNGITMGIK